MLSLLLSLLYLQTLRETYAIINRKKDHSIMTLLFKTGKFKHIYHPFSIKHIHIRNTVSIINIRSTEEAV